MPNQPGVFIVLEGGDGSGKSTQFQLIVERLKAVGHEVEVIKFPQYDQPSSTFVKAYLNGDYGPASEISPYTASMFYALDRYHASPRIKKALGEGKIVVADRYVGSNMAHQGSKFTNFAQQRGFFVWADSLEFELLGIPRPDINIFLKVPVEISLRLMSNRSTRAYTNKKLDQHESDEKHLQNTSATYDLLCKLFPKDFREIDCAPSGQLLDIVQINNRIWGALKPLLPQPKHKARGAIVKLNNQSGKEEPAHSRTLPRKKSKMAPKDAKTLSSVDLSVLAPSFRKTYDEFHAQIFQLQQKMRQIKDIERPIIESAIELTTPLQADWQWLRGFVPISKKRPINQSQEPIAIEKILDEITAPQARQSGGDIELKLVGVSPRNELDLLHQADNLTYQQKRLALERKLSSSLAQLNYTFVATVSYRFFKHLLDDNLVSHPRTAYPSGRLGHELQPEIDESPQLDMFFDRCFSLSTDTCSQLLGGGYSGLAPLVLLRGHLSRWRFGLNIEALGVALAAAKTASGKIILDQLVGLIAEVHPISARALTSDRVSKDSMAKKTPSSRG